MLDLNSKTNIKEIIFDKENGSTVELVGAKGVKLKLKRVFATEYNEGLYCILAPVNKVQGLAQGTALVFKLDEDSLCLVKEKELVKAIFNAYYSAIGG